MGATLFLPRLVGAGIANDLLLSGRVLQADEALRLGLVNEVVTHDMVELRAREIAADLLSSGPQAVQGLLETIRPSANQLDSALGREAAEQARNYATSEFAEGIAAARERRAPKF